MRFERLVIEADENTFSLDFHPRLTVISGVGRLEREGLISELVGSLSASRAGVHAEVVADNGNRFAIFRPNGARARVIDVEASADVSGRFADTDGTIDLLAVAGLDMRSAKRALRVTATDLTTSTHHEEIIRRLAIVDAEHLWGTCERVARAQGALDQTATESGSAPEDAAVVARIEEQHQRFEEAQSRAERFRRLSFIAGAMAALAAVPSAMFVSQMAAMAWVIAAAFITVVSLVQNQRMARASKAEREALAAAGAESYLGFHLQRVNGLLDSEQSRKQLMEADAEYAAAMMAWKHIAGAVSPEWADEHRGEIDHTAAQLRNVSTFGPSGVRDGNDDEVAGLAHALVQRLAEVKTVGPAGESLPLVIDDALLDLATDVKASLLEVLGNASSGQQIVFLTEDPDVAEWARVEAMTGEVAILEPGATADHASDTVTDAAVA